MTLDEALARIAALEREGARPPQCVTHGDPLVCLACEAEEDTRPEWRSDTQRLIAQAHAIEQLLREAGIGPCSLVEGVRLALARINELEREVAECIADMRRVQAEMVQEDVPGWPNSIEDWIARVQALEREVARLTGER